jgi:hypothetical protein
MCDPFSHAPHRWDVGDGMRKKDTEIPPERASNLTQPWRLLLHRAEGREREEEGRERSRLRVHTGYVDQRFQEVAVREG